MKNHKEHEQAKLPSERVSFLSGCRAQEGPLSDQHRSEKEHRTLQEYVRRMFRPKLALADVSN